MNFSLFDFIIRKVYYDWDDWHLETSYHHEFVLFHGKVIIKVSRFKFWDYVLFAVTRIRTYQAIYLKSSQYGL